MRFAFLLLIFLLVACSGNGEQDAVTPTATSVSEVNSTPQATNTVEPTSDVAASSSEADEPEIFVAPTLAPSPTPGVVDDIVAELVEGTVVEDFSFLGLSSEDWINLFISLVLILLGYVVAGWFVGVALRWLIRRSGHEVADVFLKKIEQQLRWLIVAIVASFATYQLNFLGGAAVRLFGAFYYNSDCPV